MSEKQTPQYIEQASPVTVGDLERVADALGASGEEAWAPIPDDSERIAAVAGNIAKSVGELIEAPDWVKVKVETPSSHNNGNVPVRIGDVVSVPARERTPINNPGPDSYNHAINSPHKRPGSL